MKVTEKNFNRLRPGLRKKVGCLNEGTFTSKCADPLPYTPITWVAQLILDKCVVQAYVMGCGKSCVYRHEWQDIRCFCKGRSHEV